MKLKAAVIVVLAVMAPGCASVIKGSTQSLNLTTSPEPGATCVLTSPGGTNQTVETPGTVTVERSKHDIAVTCNKAGFEEAYAVIPSSFEGWTLGNLLIGGVIGVGVDAATGAMNDYPNTFNVPMNRSDGPPATAPAGEPTS